MKKLVILLALMLLLTACTPAAPTTAPSIVPTTLPTTTAKSPTQQPISFLLYVPEEHWEHFICEEMTLETLDPALICAALVEKSALADGVIVNQVTIDDAVLSLDMNEAFLMQICTMGTTGERILIGCLINTVLSAYDCECVKLTVDGEIINSGHVVYDEPLYPIG